MAFGGTQALEQEDNDETEDAEAGSSSGADAGTELEAEQEASSSGSGAEAHKSSEQTQQKYVSPSTLCTYCHEEVPRNMSLSEQVIAVYVYATKICIL
jgi:hypothetical protein